MFDPKILLDALLAGSAKPAASTQSNAAAGAVDLGEILRRMGGAPGQGSQGGGGGLGEILEKLGRAAAQPQGGQQQGGPAPGGGQSGGQPGGGDGGLGDILGQIFGRPTQPPAPAPRGGRMEPDREDAPTSGRQGGDLLEEIFGKRAGPDAQPQAQAPQPPARPMQPQTPRMPEPPEPPHTPWGGGRSGGAIDARQQVEDLLGAIAAGQGTPEMIQQLQDMVARGQVSAGAVIGGLGSVVVGNKPGRRIEASAARMGGLELIGAIAYNAYLAYKQGRGPVAGQQLQDGPAPKGTGFEPEAQTSDAALLFIRAMIAAAVADGEIDRAEQQLLVGGLEGLGLGQQASQFLQQELERPQSVEDLVGAANSPILALQTYTAARLAIEPDTRDEQAFLQALAQGLGIDTKLAAHIDAHTTSLKV